MLAWLLVILFGLGTASPVGTHRPADPRPPQPGMVWVNSGSYAPFYPPAPGVTTVYVSPFWLDSLPVTERDWLVFVSSQPQWRRGRVAKLFADEGYLRHWRGPLDPGPQVKLMAPVTQVSWFAAQAYCRSRGLRLPTEHQWERAARASAKLEDASQDEAFRQQILDWYGRPAVAPGPVGRGTANLWGIKDMHGLVWEWVLDFNSTLLATDNRGTNDKDKLPFCGAGAQQAKDKGDYPSFMRVAFRSSLRANYTARTLGFRCAAAAP